MFRYLFDNKMNTIEHIRLIYNIRYIGVYALNKNLSFKVIARVVIICFCDFYFKVAHRANVTHDLLTIGVQTIVIFPD